MTNQLIKRCRFPKYEDYGHSIVIGAKDFHNEHGIYPNILSANSETFRRLSESMGDIDEHSHENPEDDFRNQIWERSGLVSPKYRDTQYEMGGYVWNDFGVAYSIDEGIGIDEFELRYIEEWD